MLKGFLNHGCVIVNDLLLGTRTRVHTVSFPARRARLRHSAGHTTKYQQISSGSSSELSPGESSSALTIRLLTLILGPYLIPYPKSLTLWLESTHVG